jgi:hypothetical protein
MKDDTPVTPSLEVVILTFTSYYVHGKIPYRGSADLGWPTIPHPVAG